MDYVNCSKHLASILQIWNFKVFHRSKCDRARKRKNCMRLKLKKNSNGISKKLVIIRNKDVRGGVLLASLDKLGCKTEFCKYKR